MENPNSSQTAKENPEVVEKQPEDTRPLNPQEKAAYDYVIPESKRLIRSGFHKKAFNMLDKYFYETPQMGSILKIRLCLRMMACITKICTKYIIKGEITRYDHFVRLMEKSLLYMQTWHDTLSTYIVKTNPKFAHLQGLLDELSSEAEDEMEALNRSRRSSGRLNTSFQSNKSGSGPMNSPGSGQKSSIFVNMLRQQSNLPSKETDVLENSFNFLEGSKLMVEEFTGKEINVPFFLDEFFRYFLKTTLNWGLFMKKMHKFQSAYKFLFLAYKITQEIESTLNPNLLDSCIKARMPLGVFYSEFGKHKEALEIFESLINLTQIAISLRMNRNKEKNKDAKFYIKLKATIRMLAIIFINMAIIYEQQDNYERTLESYKVGFWFVTKFLTPDEEVYKTFEKLYLDARKKYERFLKEIGEIERIAHGNKKDLMSQYENNDNSKRDHFTKLNEYLYNKFNYDTLNQSQYILIKNNTSRVNSASIFKRPNKIDMFEKSDRFYLDDIEKSSETSMNRYSLSPHKETFDASGTKITTINELESQHRFGQTASTRGGFGFSTYNTTSYKKKKNNKEKRRMYNLTPDYVPKLITSDRYMKDTNPEQEIEKFELDEEEEREYIMLLNRNIKEEGKNKKNKTGDFVDLDGYFSRTIEAKIKEKENTMKHKPIDFHRIVKNYAYFLEQEDFDKKEFGFAKQMLRAKAAETLGECSINTKYIPPLPKMAERLNVQLEAANIEYKNEAENLVKQKNEAIKDMRRAWKKERKQAKANKEDQNKKLAPLAVTLNSEEGEKLKTSPKLSSILLKHHELLGLKGLASVKREEEIKEKKLAEKMQDTEHMRKLGLVNVKDDETSARTTLQTYGTARERKQEADPEAVKKYAQTTKDMIQLMMESIERNIEQDEMIKSKIKASLPLVTVQKKKERFLKVGDDLARSTNMISVKRDASKKIFDFSELVRINKQLATGTGLKARISSPKKRFTWRENL